MLLLKEQGNIPRLPHHSLGEVVGHGQQQHPPCILLHRIAVLHQRKLHRLPRHKVGLLASQLIDVVSPVAVHQVNDNGVQGGRFPDEAPLGVLHLCLLYTS